MRKKRTDNQSENKTTQHISELKININNENENHNENNDTYHPCDVKTPKSPYTPDGSVILSPGGSRTVKKKPKSYIKKIKSGSNFQTISLTKSISNLSISSLNKFNSLNAYISTESGSKDTDVGFDLDKDEPKEADFFDEIEKNTYLHRRMFMVRYPSYKPKKDIVTFIKKKTNDDVDIDESTQHLEDNEEDGDKDGDDESIIAASVNSNRSGKNQLFQVIPPKDLVMEIMKVFLGENISNPNYQFTRKMIEERKIVDKINNYVPELRKYYLNCKQSKYLDKLDCKKCITIFRQLIRIYDYQIHSAEKYQNGAKFLLYKIEKSSNHKKIKKNNFTIDFD